MGCLTIFSTKLVDYKFSLKFVLNTPIRSYKEGRDMKTIKIEKTCACCGKNHTETSDYKLNKLGLWFNCECGSTMLVKHERTYHEREVSVKGFQMMVIDVKVFGEIVHTTQPFWGAGLALEAAHKEVL